MKRTREWRVLLVQGSSLVCGGAWGRSREKGGVGKLKSCRGRERREAAGKPWTPNIAAVQTKLGRPHLNLRIGSTTWFGSFFPFFARSH